MGCSVYALGATVGALGITKNPSAGDYAPVLPTAGVRQPTRRTAAARRSVCELMSPSSGGGFELPRHSSGDGWRLELRRVFYYSAAALTPRLSARGGSRASRAGPPPRLLPSGGAPAPSLVPPLPTVAPLLRRGYGESGCGLRPPIFFRLRQCRFTRGVLAVASTASWASWVNLFGRGFAPSSRRHRQKGTLAQMPAQMGRGVSFRYFDVQARHLRFTSLPCPFVRAFLMRQLHPRCPRRLRRATPAAPAFHDIATRGFLHRGRGLFKLRRRRCGCPPLVEQFETFPSATM